MSDKKTQSFNFANALVRPWDSGVELYLADKQPDRTVVISDFICTVHHREESIQFAPPPLTLDKTSAKMLMDALWRAGIRPTEGTMDDGATLRHLKDMRRLAFKTLNIEEP